MEKFPEADQLIQLLDTGTGNSYLGHRGEPTTGDNHDQGTFPHTRDVISRLADQAGVESVGVYTLRHNAAVAWLEAGVHIKAAADLLGHSSIQLHM